MAGEGSDSPAPWYEGEVVRIIAGPFIDWLGTIEEVSGDRRKVIVIIGINPAPIELDFNQIERA